MREMIKHFWENNRAEVVAKTRLNCHAIGLHSIMLVDKPGCMIRMFVTDRGHEMWKNSTVERHLWSIGFHQHHCNIKLHVIRGAITNHVLEPSLNGELYLYDYLYESPILNTNTGRFVKNGSVRCRFLESTLVQAYCNPLELPASVYHTVEVDKNRIAAWIVYEGAEWSSYAPFTISNRPDLDKETFKDMYKSADEATIQALLDTVL